MPPPKLQPRDAASLALIRYVGDEPQVLMGRRHSTHAFMPGVFVFPGGRVEPGDARIPAACELQPSVEKHLLKRCSKRRARALAMAAIRETFEETGLMLGQPSKSATLPSSDPWLAFVQEGILPALELLDYLGRAITPPGQVRRFHARFFIAEAKHTQGNLLGDGELLELDFYPLSETNELPTASITQLVLSELGHHLAEPRLPDDPRPYFLFRNNSSKIVYE